MKFKGFPTIYEFLDKLNEGGHAVEARPMTQKETVELFSYVEKNIFPKLGLEGIGSDAALLGSYNKKTEEQLSGDIDIAVSVDRIATANSISVDSVLDFIDEVLTKEGYETKKIKGFNQVSASMQIPKTKDYGQVDFMLSTNLNWSKFIYYSPNFKNAESKYKGAYRNILLASIIGTIFRNIEKYHEDKAEIVSQYAIRIEKGIYKIHKSYLGKSGNIVKSAKVLKDQDKFITNTPDEVAKIMFGDSYNSSHIMTFESLWELLHSKDFLYKDRLKDCVKSFVNGIRRQLPIPQEVEDNYPELI